MCTLETFEGLSLSLTILCLDQGEFCVEWKSLSVKKGHWKDLLLHTWGNSREYPSLSGVFFEEEKGPFLQPFFGPEQGEPNVFFVKKKIDLL